MIFIQHRVNKLSDLEKISNEHGVEIDVRYHENELILHHDPFKHHQTDPVKLKTFLKHWKNDGFIILNIKTEGIEQLCIKLMKQFQIKNWFFLDLSMPAMVKYSLESLDISKAISPSNLAIRFSEYEPIEYALSFEGRAKWLWVDCFNHLPLTDSIYVKIKKANFKICIVSPELQNHPIENIKNYKQKISGMEIDAICTKRPDLWVD